MGKETVNVDNLTGKFQFNPQSPGKYELNLRGVGSYPCFGYQEFEVDRDLTDLRISGTQMPYVRTMLEDSRGGRVDPRQIQIFARRKELTGPGQSQKIDFSTDSTRLAPGRWEFAVQPSPAYYPARFLTNGNPTQGRVDGWNEDMIVSSVGTNVIKFVLSNAPGAIHGTVTLGSQYAAGAPVFLEVSEIEPARRFREPYMVRTDTRGQYQFTGLAPGRYRIFASFEYQNPSAFEFDSAGALGIKIEETGNVQQDLTLFVAR
jgi:hypothetical protein